MKLAARRAGLPGNEISFLLVPLTGHLPLRIGGEEF
jgi:hypothetical protein